MAQILLNGEPREIDGRKSVLRLLEGLGLDPRAVAVERNGEILPRPRFDLTPLADGDRIEVVRFVQGG